MRSSLPGALLASIIAISSAACDSQSPDPQAMRRYRIGNLSDQQILDLHRHAELEFEQIKLQAEAEGEKFWKQKNKDLARCRSDVAFRTRNPGACQLPITWEQIGKPPISAEELFEASILGFCNYALTVRDAKKHGCLPP